MLVLLSLVLVLILALLLVFLLLLLIIPSRSLLCLSGPWEPLLQARAVESSTRPGQPHQEGAQGSGGAKEIEADKLILVAFVI